MTAPAHASSRGPALASIHGMAQVFDELVGVCLDACRQFEGRELFGTRLPSGAFRWTTYGEFQAMVDRARAGLAAFGIGPGDRVAMVSGNRVECAVVCHATYGLEAALAPVTDDHAAEREDELRFVLADSAPKVVVASSDVVYGEVRRIAQELAGSIHVVGMDLPESDEHSYARLLRRGDSVPVLPHHPTKDAVAMLAYTMDDEGHAKASAFSHGSIASTLNALGAAFPISADERSVSLVPWALPYGQVCELLHFMRSGASCAICDDPGNVLVDMKEIAPTVLVGLPRTFSGLYASIVDRIGSQSAPVRKLFEDAIRERLRARSGQHEGTVGRIDSLVDDQLFFSRIRARLGGRLRVVASASAALEPEVAEFFDCLGVPVLELAGPQPSSEPIVRAAAGPSKEHRKDPPDESKAVP